MSNHREDTTKKHGLNLDASHDYLKEKELDYFMTGIQCIPMEIEQVFINLIKNSCQAMTASAPAQPRITLSTLNKNEDYAPVYV
jgi:C4-dicarboxylate-specific signal transduction histidine kinase